MTEKNKISAVNMQKNLELMKNCETTREGLALIAETRYHQPAGESHALADEIISHLSSYKMPVKAPDPAVCNALNTFYLQELLPRDAEIRVGILRRMNFAMEVFSDEGLLCAFEEAPSFSDLYEKIFEEDHEDSLAEEILQRDHLLTGITQLNLSPVSTKYLTKQLSEGEFYISNILAMAMDAFLLRAATALHLCLCGMSSAEAVSRAVQNTQLELYPLQPIEKGISAAILIFGILSTLFLTEVFLEYYDLPLFLAETLSIISGLLLYQEFDQQKERLSRGILSLLMHRRTRSRSSKETA